jgi:hypothetical protein
MFANKMLEELATVLTAIVGLAVVAVMVSKNAQTPQVIQAFASGFNNALGVAEAPVTGAHYSPNLSYPSDGFGGNVNFIGSGGY